MSRKICLDAGHYGKYNRSPAVKTYYESDMNWKLHLLLKAELEALGFAVITTRPDQNTDLGLTARGKKSKGCDLFISIHSNAPGNKVYENIDYPLAIVMRDGRGHTLGRRLADCVAATMETKQSARICTKKGTNGGEWYSVLHGCSLVGTMGMILEHSFHTNTRSTNWLLGDENLARLAKAEAAVIAEYFSEEDTVNIQLTVLKKGARGTHVKALQDLLLGSGQALPKYGADSHFGAETEEAVRGFQKARGLSADGIVGRNTWSALLGVTA